MQIGKLANETGVSAETIRYYESIRLLPAPARERNGYRAYGVEDIERLKLVNGARRLDFSLDEIREILDLRDRGLAPCEVMLETLEKKSYEIRQRIEDLKRLEGELDELYRLGLTFPTDDVQGKDCVCHLVSQQG